MTNFLKALGFVVVGAVVGALVAVSFGGSNVSIVPTGGTYSQSEQSFGQGASFGTSRQTTISSTGAVKSGTLTQGGGVSATTTNGSTVLDSTLVDTENVVSISRIAGNAGGTTNVTLPSASSLTRLVNTGDTFTLFVTNATTTANVPLTFVAGGNMQLISASSTANKLVLGSLRSAKIDFVLATSTSFVTAYFTPFE